MSFILDALRKSEHERQRQTGPALVETPVAAPAARTNRWATAAIVLLVVNLIAIGVVLLTKSRDGKDMSPPQATAAGSQPPASTGPTGSPAATTVPGAAPPPANDSATQARAPVPPPAPQPTPMMRPAERPPTMSSGRNPLREEIADEPMPSADAGLASAAQPPPGPPAVQSRGTVRPGTVVYQSLPEADAVGSRSVGGAASEAQSTSNLPRADELAVQGGPELRLELHVYSTRPAERMVFINSRQYREGDTTPEGAHIEQITPDGVVMSMNGNRFLLSRE
jgi:general secretion pathway protein B